MSKNKSEAEELLERLGKRPPSSIRPSDALKSVIYASFNYKRGRDAIYSSSEDVREALQNLTEQDVKNVREDEVKALITPYPSWSWYETSREARTFRQKLRR